MFSATKNEPKSITPAALTDHGAQPLDTVRTGKTGSVSGAVSDENVCSLLSLLNIGDFKTGGRMVAVEAGGSRTLVAVFTRQ